MHISTNALCLTLFLFATATLSSPLLTTNTLRDRSTPVKARSPANTSVNPQAVTGTTCDDPSVALVSHDTNVAILSICGGIAGAIEFCGGDPATTVGASGTAKFTLTASNADAGATINVSKGRWEGCVRAAQATCPTGTFTSICVGGTSDGAGFEFVLSANN
ncbi:hypothetical protein EDD36DRAFT_9350 [Exophiala viscosa]|uniref:AA1-like domain-containing protein n=1 Tax=Exophiala viscosa TaxID=2486360 RepID=A0AAN6E6U3_9EURO|nr:hypothetical protein EDD36DRAFT_9350 [Exophiala viscosa]